MCGLGLAACSKSQPAPEQAAPAAEQAPAEPAPAANPEADAAYDAKTLFNGKCVVCHGSVGAGDGPGAAALTPKPRAFADATWQASVKDEQIENAILMGGAAVGKSPAMPANPDLQSKPEVVKQLVKIVRGFKKG
jgi:mono/diheme cytochrome c family protein